VQQLLFFAFHSFIFQTTFHNLYSDDKSQPVSICHCKQGGWAAWCQQHKISLTTNCCSLLWTAKFFSLQQWPKCAVFQMRRKPYPWVLLAFIFQIPLQLKTEPNTHVLQAHMLQTPKQLKTEPHMLQVHTLQIPQQLKTEQTRQSPPCSKL